MSEEKMNNKGFKDILDYLLKISGITICLVMLLVTSLIFVERTTIIGFGAFGFVMFFLGFILRDFITLEQYAIIGFVEFLLVVIIFHDRSIFTFKKIESKNQEIDDIEC